MPLRAAIVAYVIYRVGAQSGEVEWERSYKKDGVTQRNWKSDCERKCKLDPECCGFEVAVEDRCELYNARNRPERSQNGPVAPGSSDGAGCDCCGLEAAGVGVGGGRSGAGRVTADRGLGRGGGEPQRERADLVRRGLL